MNWNLLLFIQIQYYLGACKLLVLNAKQPVENQRRPTADESLVELKENSDVPVLLCHLVPFSPL